MRPNLAIARLCAILCAALIGIAVCAVPISRALLPAVPTVFTFRGVAMAPAAPLAELLGGEVTVGRDGALVIGRAEKTFACTPGTIAASQNGAPLWLATAPFDLAGVVYLPVQPLVEALGGTTAADEQASTLRITLPGLPPLTLPLETHFQRESWLTRAGSELYVVNLDGTGLRRLTFNMVSERSPVMTADGARLAYLSGEQVVMRAIADPQPTVLATDGAHGHYERIISVSADVLLMEKSSIVEHNIVRLSLGDKTETLASGSSTTVSPEGQYLGYVDRDGKIMLQTVGGQPRALGVGEMPRFSPDGSYLLFRKLNAAPNGVVTGYLANYPMGNDPGTLREPPLAERAVDDTPGDIRADGQQIVFTRAGQGIYTMTPDFSEYMRVTRDARDRAPRFTPDGRAIVFTRDGGLSIMQADGTALRQLTTGLNVAPDYTFTPDGLSLLFTAEPVRVEGM